MKPENEITVCCKKCGRAYKIEPSDSEREILKTATKNVLPYKCPYCGSRRYEMLLRVVPASQ